jgi:N-acetylmuramoyl-L-alanine amidase
VLVELGLLSNREDARALADPGHRARLAGAIRRALDRYFASLPR